MDKLELVINNIDPKTKNTQIELAMRKFGVQIVKEFFIFNIKMNKNNREDIKMSLNIDKLQGYIDWHKNTFEKKDQDSLTCPICEGSEDFCKTLGCQD